MSPSHALLVVGMMAWAGSAGAAEVTLCARDTEPPSNGNFMNLQTALQQGGRITFKCGAGTTILVARSHIIERDTEIDGGGAVTLDGGGNRFGTIVGGNDTVVFRASRLRVVHAGGPPPAPGPPGTVSSIGRNQGGFITGHFRSVDLEAVSVEHSWFPVWLSNGALVAKASSFANNDGSVLSGGAIDVRDHCRFTNNRGSPIDGATVNIETSDFLANAEPVRVAGGHLRVYRSTFTANVTLGSGGALNVRSNATIEESEFRNNGAASGGALVIGGAAAEVSLRAATFDGNFATEYGGAISLDPAAGSLQLKLAHVTFQDNRAVLGGALALRHAVHSVVTVNAGAAAFVRNQAGNTGGAIFAPSTSILFSRGVFIGNRAGTAGGAIAALQQADGSTTLANSLIVRNTAPKGAAFSGNAATFINTTVDDGDGTAIWSQSLPVGPLPGTAIRFPIKFVNSILSGQCGPAASTAPYLDGGHNLQFPNGSCGPSISVAFPSLGPYYVPFFWSAARHGGDQTVCDAAPISRKDLYNARRPLGGPSCSIGAVEGDIAHLLHRWLNPEKSPARGNASR